MALTMELDEAVAGNSPEISTEFNLKRMLANVPVRILPTIPEWREIPLTKGIPNHIGVQIRVQHRRLMAFRWRFRELRVQDFNLKHLPRDWHEWMECDGGEYGVYNCTCDAWDTPPVTRASGRRPAIRAELKSEVPSQIVVDTSSSYIESRSDEMVPHDLELCADSALDHPLRSDAPELHPLRPGVHDSRARTHSPRSTDACDQRHIQICSVGLVHHDLLVAQDRASLRSVERGRRPAQRRLRVEVGAGGVWCGMHALR